MVGDLYGRKIPLSKTTKFIVDNRGRTAPTAAYGIPLIATNCISNDQLYPAYEKLRFVSQETYTSWFRSHPQPGDIILTNKGSQNGAICLVPDPVDFVIAQDMVALRADEEVIDPLFLFAALRSPGVQREIRNLDVSGVIPHFKKSDFDNLHLPYPDRVVQEAIGRIYFDFCHKIELNRRMNATLEEMARALFQSWFVDFDPVRAKLDGRTPAGLDPATAALFPDSFEDSPLGPIPKGWHQATVDDMASFNRGTINPGSFANETFDHFSLPAFDNGRTPNIEFGRAIMSNKLIVTPDCVLLSKLNPHIPRIWLPEIHATRRSVCSTEFMVVCPKPRMTREYLFSLFTSAAFGSVYQTLVTGTTGSHQRLRPESVLGMKVSVPPPSLVQKFTRIVKPSCDRIHHNLHQSRTLAILRDTMLPKLLSGELRITEPH
jgi:type I restriction enzyme S subunit